MPHLIRDGHLYLAQPPLYRLTHKGESVYATDEADKDRLIDEMFGGSDKVEISRFKGLGEMRPDQLKSTTMNRETRTLLKVNVPEGFVEQEETSDLVERLMGKKPELRFEYIQANAPSVNDLDI